MDKKVVYTRQFFVLWLGTLLFFVSFNLIIPELPDYLSSLGGAKYKGLIIALFTLSAGFSRPFTGKLADLVGRKPIIYIGAILGVIVLALYPVMGTVVAFFFLRFVHGFSNGFTPTAVTALIADSIPSERRGEAMGFYGMAISAGLAMGPAIGGQIKLSYSTDMMFYVATGFGVLALLLFFFAHESNMKRQSFQWKMLKIGKDEVIEPSVMPSAIAMFASIFGFGVILTLIPDMSKSLGIANKGTFFTFYTCSSFVVRFLAGRLSDRIGRLLVLRASALLLSFAFALLALTTSQMMLYISAVVLGLAVGMYSPTVMAWNIDLCPQEKRGRGMATIYIAMELAIGLGAFLSGVIYADDLSRLHLSFWLCVAINLLGFAYLVLVKDRNAEAS